MLKQGKGVSAAVGLFKHKAAGPSKVALGLMCCTLSIELSSDVVTGCLLKTGNCKVI